MGVRPSEAIERRVRTVDASWSIVDPKDQTHGVVRVLVDLTSGSCQLLSQPRAESQKSTVVQAETIDLASVETELSGRGDLSMVVPGVLVVVRLAGRAEAYVRSPWVDTLRPGAGCCELMQLKIAFEAD